LLIREEIADAPSSDAKESRSTHPRDKPEDQKNGYGQSRSQRPSHIFIAFFEKYKLTNMRSKRHGKSERKEQDERDLVRRVSTIHF
jgi:hypothetical protein